jgi:shikimate kinase
VLITREYHNITLVGFMGTGKSSVGHCVSALLHFQFADTDALIETRFGASITEIFAREGEAKFREQESLVIADLVHCRRTVISTGGGVVLQPANMESLKRHSLVVCLWASVETIFERVKSQSHRPLLQCDDPRTRIRDLLAAREPFYRQADILLSTECRTIREVAQQIVNQLRLAQAQSHPA